MRKREMNEKQKRFCDEYLKDLNATKAAIRAGYSKETARQIGYENLTKPYIQKYLKSKIKKIEKKNELTIEKVINELQKIGFDIEPDGEIMFYTNKIKALETLLEYLQTANNGGVPKIIVELRNMMVKENGKE
ncbi:MAG: terminase small subunit [Melioribacteraceae bacterium]